MQTIDENNLKNRTYWAMFLAVLLVGANLRAPLTSAGALITIIREDLMMTHSLAGMVTTLPLLAFAFLSPFAPKISRRIGMEWTILLALLAIFVGVIVRSLFGVTALFIGTLLVGLGIAIGNVLSPVIIQLHFPLRVGIVMGFYAISMNIFGALGSGISISLANISSFGWKGALSAWVVVAILAIIFWLPQLKRTRDPLTSETKTTGRSYNLWRSTLAWFITIFMGLQSLMYYTFITWLPDILTTKGFSMQTAGWMLFLMQLALIPITFIVPIVAEKMNDQKLLSAVTASFFIISIFGIMSGNAIFVPISAMMFGMACGSSFSLCMMFFNLRTVNSTQAAEMSGMAQSIGYLLAAIGPTLFGALHDIYGNWNVPFIVLICISVVILFVATLSGRDVKVHVSSSYK